jgi:murein DD-endopeptidase MepM/ murein hydrolase activator NlpD
MQMISFHPRTLGSGVLQRRTIAWLFAVLLASRTVSADAAEVFQFPTANRALIEPGGEERFFVGTIGRGWTSGAFGCVRSEGWQFHEGLDVRCLERDKRGEPIDTVHATLSGTVAYLNQRQALSNFGKYIILRHAVDGVELYSVYAHLSEIRAGLQAGQAVKAGDQIAVMGRTANTREGISRDRAHVHFELNLLLNERFAEWHRKHRPGQRNDHGGWNGQNLAGLDPRDVLWASAHQGERFNLVAYLRTRPALCRVLVRDTNIPFLRRYPMLAEKNSVAEREGVEGYEIALSFNGLPLQFIPRAASEMKAKSRVLLLSVNEAEYQRAHCGKIVARKSGRWALASRGEDLLSLLTY